MENLKDLQESYEECILCGTLTEVKKSEPIEFRDGYIQGAGQLCPKCQLEV